MSERDDEIPGLIAVLRADFVLHLKYADRFSLDAYYEDLVCCLDATLHEMKDTPSHKLQAIQESAIFVHDLDVLVSSTSTNSTTFGLK